MAHGGVDGWETDYEVYTQGQVEAVLDHISVEVAEETAENFVMAFCPYHGNTNSPALSVNTATGKFRCFNPACDESGTLAEMVQYVEGLTPIKAELLIAKQKKAGAAPVRLSREVVPEKFEVWQQSTLDGLAKNLWNNDRAIEYMHGRGFENDTLKHFGVGYSPATILRGGRRRPEMIAVPMHDVMGQPIGLVGRGINSKVFKNSKDLPKRYTAWNVHRAKQAGGTVIIVESTFDAMRVHQAGYPNVIALLGGSITDHHAQQIERYFSKVIIMTDYDWLVYEECRRCGGECRGHRPGRELGRKIATKVTKRIMWAAYDDDVVYPHDAKDACDMTDDEIRQCLRHAISNIEYRKWNPEGLTLAH